MSAATRRTAGGRRRSRFRPGPACCHGLHLLPSLGHDYLMLLSSLPLMDAVDSELHRKLLGRLHERILEEIFGGEGMLCGPALLGVVLEQLANEIHGMIRHPAGMRNALLEVFAELVGKDRVTALGLVLLPERANLVNVWPGLGGGMAKHSENEVQLSGVTRALEEGGPTEHLRNNATNAPHIDLGRVNLATQQKFGRAVPKRNDLVRQPLHLGIPRPRQTPIGNLQLTLPVDKKIGGLEIAMDDPIGVHIMHSREELLRPGFDVILRQADVGCLEDAGKVILGILEHHEHVLWDLSSLCDICQYTMAFTSRERSKVREEMGRR